jgi:hypothetical protein
MLRANKIGDEVRPSRAAPGSAPSAQGAGLTAMRVDTRLAAVTAGQPAAAHEGGATLWLDLCCSLCSQCVYYHVRF